MGKVSEAIEAIRTREKSMAGDDLEALLVDLGFEVRQCSSPGHYVVTHDGLEEFRSTSFDKSHNKFMLPNYPRQIRRVLQQYQHQLETLLGDRNEQT
jgi:hypothetical protein